MSQIQLKYGRTSIPFEFDEGSLAVIGENADTPPLSDVEIGKRLDTPIESETIDAMVNPGESVLFVVPDATRKTGCGQIINLLTRRLIANGVEPSNIRAIFATGIHRQVTEDEKRDILTPFIAQRVKTLDHNPRDLAGLVRLGETSDGIPIELNRALTEHDHVILLGGVTFHYFAGFTGGRKLICPGLASARTISATHKLAFDCEQKARREGVGTGLLDGNAVNQAFIEAASFIKPAFAVNAIVDDAGAVVDLYCGDWLASHRTACDAYAAKHIVSIDEKSDLVIASCGGFPHDINLIQAHKALDAASYGCREGGTIVLLAECSDGTGRHDFLDWFDSIDSRTLADRLCEKYQVNGQTAWSFLRKAERFDIGLITSLEDEVVKKLRCRKIDSIPRVRSSGYIMPFGAKFSLCTQDLPEFSANVRAIESV